MREEMQEAVIEATRRRLEHADQMEYHRNMTAYYSDKEARLNQELNKPEEAAKSYKAPRNGAIPNGEFYSFQPPEQA